MRIGLFTDTYYPQVNGVATSVHQLAEELIKHGHEVYVVTSSNSRRISSEDNIIKLPGIRIKKLYGYNVSGFYSYIGARYLKKLKLDVIHAHSEYGIGLFARIVAKSYDIPLIYTYHTMWEDYTHYVTKITKGHFENPIKKFVITSSKLLADKCTELIVPSLKTKKAMIRYGVTNKINIIPTGLDLSFFASHQFKQEDILALRRKYDFKPSDFVAIYVGRIALEKNIDEIIEAFKKIKQENNTQNIKLLIVGDGPYVEELKEVIQSNGLEDSIKLTGLINRDEVAIYYQVGDIFVSASVSETQGLTFIEAMASHLPVLCYFDLNLEEIIKDEVNGFFVDNSDDFADKLIELSRLDHYKFNDYGIAAKERANHYSSANFYEKVINVYDNAIRNKRRENFKNK